jgi:hypothetical protein
VTIIALRHVAERQEDVDRQAGVIGFEHVEILTNGEDDLVGELRRDKIGESVIVAPAQLADAPIAPDRKNCA